MLQPRAPSLDQLQIFLAIVEAGSFTAAARRLNRAPSVVSYAIGNLETQLGLELFDRKSTRKPMLTEAGRAIVSDSRGVARGVDDLLAKARGLQAGLEAEVALAVDVMLPTERLVDALEGFGAAFPTVTLRLYVEALGAVAQLVLDRRAGIGISGPMQRALAGLETREIGTVPLVPVAAPGHPLSRIEGPIPPGVAREHIQLVLTDRSSLTEGEEFAVIGVQTWRLADLGAKHALLLAGIGWGSLPEPMARADLAAGRLARLALDQWDNQRYAFQSIHRADAPPGPAARWLIDRLASTASA